MRGPWRADSGLSHRTGQPHRHHGLDPVYSSICGYTEGDLDRVFAPELEGLDRERVGEWYNGYSWLGAEKVYNPYDVLLLLRRGSGESRRCHWTGR